MNYHEETIKILDDLGINGAKASKVMGISHSLFGNKYNSNQRNKFSKDNYINFAKWLKGYVSEIKC